MEFPSNINHKFFYLYTGGGDYKNDGKQSERSLVDLFW